MARSARGSNFRDQREAGRQQVFDAIRASDGIARIDIAARIGASPATVTAIATELLGEGLIEEVVPEAPAADAKRGRPRVALKVRGSAHLIAGVKVARTGISTMVVDFEGHELAAHEFQLDKPCLPAAELAHAVKAAIAETCAMADLDTSRISGVGIGLAGHVRAPDRFVHWSPSLDQRGVDFGPVLDSVFDCPVLVENDANLVAKAEQLFGYGRGVANFVVVTVEHGVGMGIVINNEIYRGKRGVGAEFGHTKVQLQGALCQCGQRGCLEAYVGDYALLREANLVASENPTEQLSALWASAQSGDATAQAIFDRARKMFALGLANVINIFDPELIILAGQRAAFDHLDADAAAHDVKNNVVQTDAPLPEIRVHPWSDEMWSKGAAAYAIERVSALKIRELGQNAV